MDPSRTTRSSGFEHETVSESLPDEALRLIFRFVSLRCPSSFSHALTCKRWLRLAQLARSAVHVDESRSISGDLLLASLSRFPNLTSLQLANQSMTRVPATFLHRLGRTCPNLISLSLPDLSLGQESIQDQASTHGQASNQELSLSPPDPPSARVPFLTQEQSVAQKQQPVSQARVSPDLSSSIFYLRGLEFFFHSCTALEQLSLVLPGSLASLPPSLLSLPRLQHLRLCAHGVKSMPSQIPNSFPSLQILEIESGSLHNLPETLGEWGSFQELTLSCENLQVLPEISGQQPSSLKHLCLNLPQLGKLPEGFCKLPSLLSVKLLSCSILDSLPEDLGYLHSLKTLELIRLPEISTLPESLGQLSSLEKLHLMMCPAFQRLPESASLLTRLKSLRIMHCGSLSSLPDGIGNLQNLQILEVTGSLVLEQLPPSVTALKSLTSLSICRCGKLQSLPEDIGQLTQLQELAVVMNDEISELPESLSSLPRLEVLVVSDCLNLHTLPKGLQHGQMTWLRCLELSDLPSLDGLPRNLGRLPNIQEVHLRGDNLVKQPQLSQVFSPRPWLPIICSVLGLVRLHALSLLAGGSQDSKGSSGLHEYASCQRGFGIFPPDSDSQESDTWIVMACEMP
ncbi:hypothetical protein CLOP_g12586 [Closterium sp. NIES-67]|nr:hypothetical protein CLOP_g23688 [Closterium sp. NIES-67]GJP82337.1 hypothetical protein CLOP_g12586 [Closterium sp. NIES-67]